MRWLRRCSASNSEYICAPGRPNSVSTPFWISEPTMASPPVIGASLRAGVGLPDLARTASVGAALLRGDFARVILAFPGLFTGGSGRAVLIVVRAFRGEVLRVEASR